MIKWYVQCGSVTPHTDQFAIANTVAIVIVGSIVHVMAMVQAVTIQFIYKTQFNFF